MAKYGVLFVDDDENILSSIKTKLTSQEYEKYFANSVEKALEILTITSDIYVVVLDLNMPEVNGQKLLEYINKYYPDIEKIVLSGYSDSATIMSVLNSYHISAYIKKPWTYNTEFIPIIKSCVQRYIERKEIKNKIKKYNYEKKFFTSKEKVVNTKIEKLDELLKKIEKEKEDNKKLIGFIINYAQPYIEKSQELFKLDQEELIKKLDVEKEELNKEAKFVIKNLDKIKEYIQIKTKAQSKNKKVLIVDDSKENRQLLANIIQTYTKHKVIVAKSGYDIMKIIGKLDSEDIGIILLDIMMPGIDGYQIAEALKNNKKTKEIPIVFISAMTDIKDMAKAFEKGAYDYIKKPINKNEVLKKVEEHIRAGR
ncbi:response regulator [Haliovirga abyssi]|uniref:Response regulatory domain-containing protein n=1 Tax=Haliovirga abyssi TaxID=2996794 RepID=A0AAU9DVY2_9FUSO|nr:response regulator [Haliovirga abyssi]BDU51549.1 hypothetical protein HLVA_21180 [Haliovirga abyssi]